MTFICPNSHSFAFWFAIQELDIQSKLEIEENCKRYKIICLQNGKVSCETEEKQTEITK